MAVQTEMLQPSNFLCVQTPAALLAMMLIAIMVMLMTLFLHTHYFADALSVFSVH